VSSSWNCSSRLAYYSLIRLCISQSVTRSRTNKSAFILYRILFSIRRAAVSDYISGFLISVTFSPLEPQCSIGAYKSRGEREREKERSAFVYIQGHQLTS
jgi:hypothetical protein